MEGADLLVVKSGLPTKKKKVNYEVVLIKRLS